MENIWLKGSNLLEDAHEYDEEQRQEAISSVCGGGGCWLWLYRGIEKASLSVSHFTDPSL